MKQEETKINDICTQK